MKLILKIYDSVTYEIRNLIYFPISPFQCCCLVAGFHRDQEPPTEHISGDCILLCSQTQNYLQTRRKQVYISFIKHILVELQTFLLEKNMLSMSLWQILNQSSNSNSERKGTKRDSTVTKEMQVQHWTLKHLPKWKTEHCTGQFTTLTILKIINLLGTFLGNEIIMWEKAKEKIYAFYSAEHNIFCSSFSLSPPPI